jgi:hypothetical protein
VCRGRDNSVAGGLNPVGSLGPAWLRGGSAMRVKAQRLPSTECQNVAVGVYEPRADVAALEPGGPLLVRVERLPVLLEVHAVRRQLVNGRFDIADPPPRERRSRLPCVLRRGIDVDFSTAST